MGETSSGRPEDRYGCRTVEADQALELNLGQTEFLPQGASEAEQAAAEVRARRPATTRPPLCQPRLIRLGEGSQLWEAIHTAGPPMKLTALPFGALGEQSSASRSQ